MRKVYRSLKIEINIIQKQLVQHRTEINQIQKCLNTASSGGLLFEAESEIDNDFVLPCSTHEMFENLEEKLTNSKEYRQKIVSS